MESVTNEKTELIIYFVTLRTHFDLLEHAQRVPRGGFRFRGMTERAHQNSIENVISPPLPGGE